MSTVGGRVMIQFHLKRHVVRIKMGKVMNGGLLKPHSPLCVNRTPVKSLKEVTMLPC